MRKPLRLAVLPLLSLALSGCGTMMDPTTWFESNNQEPPMALQDIKPTLKVRTLWSTDTGAGEGGQDLRLALAYDQGHLFLADHEGMVESLDAGTGHPLWTVQTVAPISGGPGVGGGLVLVGTLKAQVIALHEDDGREAWRAKVTSEVLSVPRAAEGMVVVHTVDGHLFGLSADSGERKWTYTRGEPVLTLRGSSAPVLYRGTAITGFSNGTLAEVSLATGDPRWEVVVSPPHGRSELERIVDIDADPVVEDNVAYAVTYQGEVAAVGADTGVVLWRRPMSAYAGLATDWRHLFVTDADGRVWGLDLQGGAALWKQEKLLRRRLTAPAVLGSHVLIGDLEGYVHWLSYDDGAQEARVRVSSSPISTPPLVMGDVAYVYADDGTLAALTTAAPSH
jgi:outer membrane protein assembly factor BamB